MSSRLSFVLSSMSLASAAVLATSACDLDQPVSQLHRSHFSYLVHRGEGAQVWAGDHEAQIIIFPNALAADTTISIGRAELPAAADDYQVVGNAFEYGPSGTRFDPLALILLRFDPSLLHGERGVSILGVQDDGTAQLLDNIAIDWDTSTVTGQTAHFTTFMPVLVPSIAIGTSDGDPTAPIVANATSPRHVTARFGTGGTVQLQATEQLVVDAGTPGHDVAIVLDSAGTAPAGSRPFVNAVVEDPAPSDNLSAPAITAGFVGGGTGWDTILGAITGLSQTPADASGTFRFSMGTTLAQSICQYAPVGYPSARVRVTVIMPGSTTPIVFWLTLTRPSYC